MDPEPVLPSIRITHATGGYLVELLTEECEEDQPSRLKWELHVFTDEQSVAEFVVRTLREESAVAAGTDQANEVTVSDITKER